MKYDKLYLSANIFVLFVLGLAVIGCSTTGKRPDRHISQTTFHKQLPAEDRVKSMLYNQHNEWKGVPYQLGGLSKKGIDCSGFVYKSFKRKFNIKLPRSTKLQAKLGREISKNKLKSGDLVFFKTGLFVRHVGIFIEGQKFLHASTSKGVMISRLDNRYWNNAYWKSIRI